MAKKNSKSLSQNRKVPLSSPAANNSWDAFFHTPSGLLLICALLCGLILWAFWPSLQGRFLFFDDNGYLVANSSVNNGLTWDGIRWAFTSLGCSNWVPLTWLSHMMDFEFYGANPARHHATNIFFHAASAVLLFLSLKKMTGALWPSLVATILFALHPLRVESVTWISERKDVLSVFFGLLALWTYACFAEESKKTAGRTKLFYGLTFLFFAFSLMSKSMLVTLPCVLLLLDFCPLERWRFKKIWVLAVEKIPFFLLVVPISIVAEHAEKTGNSFILTNLSLSLRIETAFMSYARLLGKMFYPANLSVFYPYPPFWPKDRLFLAITLILGISAVALFLWRRRPYLLVGWFWYLGTMVPVLGFVQEGAQSMANRYTYFPMIGISLLLAWCLCDLSKRWPHRTMIVTAIVALATALCMMRTRVEAAYFKDDLTLWNRAIAATTEYDNYNFMAHCCLGTILLQTDPDRALAEFQRSVDIFPDYNEAQRNLASLLHQRGRIDEAMVHYQKAWDISPTDSRPQYGLAIAYYQKGNADEAIMHFQKALTINPDNLEYLNGLAMLLVQKNRFAEAVPLLKEICDIQTNNPGAFNNLGFVLVKNGQLDEGISAFQKAVNLAPGFTQAQNNLTEALNAKQQSESLSVPTTNQPAPTNR